MFDRRQALFNGSDRRIPVTTILTPLGHGRISTPHLGFHEGPKIGGVGEGVRRRLYQRRHQCVMRARLTFPHSAVDRLRRDAWRSLFHTSEVSDAQGLCCADHGNLHLKQKYGSSPSYPEQRAAN